jgi:hypothetical protein
MLKWYVGFSVPFFLLFFFSPSWKVGGGYIPRNCKSIPEDLWVVMFLANR